MYVRFHHLQGEKEVARLFDPFYLNVHLPQEEVTGCMTYRC